MVSRTGLAIVAALLGMTAGANASPAVSNDLMLPTGGKTTTSIPSHDNGGGTPVVAPGQTLGIACADVDRGGDVRVILNVTQAPGETASDLGVVLATRQRVTHGAVHIRVPDLPDLSNHTVNVKVFVVGSKGTTSCDAGRIKIT
ncbi:MAG: hypothetical protein WCA81_15720 [Rhizomicrobium sp.]